ncbi:MAG TPA: LysM peptidoglycan-binding domain-containing protein [Thermaerobacter sp.]
MLVVLLIVALGRDGEPSRAAPVAGPVTDGGGPKGGAATSLAGPPGGIWAAEGGGSAAAPPVPGRVAVDRDGAVRVVVRPGETLWEVARRLGRPDRDPRDVVAAIMEASGLSTAALRPGMVLTVPADWARR